MKYLVFVFVLLLTVPCYGIDTLWVVTVDTVDGEVLELTEPILLGDANGSGEVDIDDVIFLMEYIFADGEFPAEYCFVQTKIISVDSTQYVQDSCEVIETLQHKIYDTYFGEVLEEVSE